MLRYQPARLRNLPIRKARQRRYPDKKQNLKPYFLLGFAEKSDKNNGERNGGNVEHLALIIPFARSVTLP